MSDFEVLIQKSMSPPVEWVWEARARARFGVNLNEMRAARMEALIEGVDWRTERRRIEISGSGLVKLEEHFALLMAQRGTARDGAHALPGRRDPAYLDPGRLLTWPGRAAPQKLIVFRVGFANKRVVLAVFELGGGAVTVRVRDNKFFLPGMAILATPPGPEGGIWMFAGNPDRPEAGPMAPRSRGRW